MYTTTVSTIMSREPLYVTPETSVRVALALAAKEKSDHLIVSDDGNVVGILCSCDIERARGDATVAERMKAPVVSVQGGTLVGDAAEIMRQKGVGSLPVLAGTLLVGIVTRADLVRAGVPRERIGSACASCGEEHHVRVSGAPFCVECLESARDPADLGSGD